MSQSKLTLPKKGKDGIPYLSYSQISTWKKSKKDYIRQHFFKEPFVSNDYIEFGSLIGEALEKGEFGKFSNEDRLFLSSIPRYDVFEKYLVVKRKGYNIIGYSDSVSNCFTKLLDYKTGDVVKKASGYESEDYTQLEIYSAAIQQQHAILPSDVSVVLIDRKGNPYKGESLRLGGKFVTIRKEITQERVDKVLNEIDNIAKEISDYYKVFLKLKEVK